MLKYGFSDLRLNRIWTFYIEGNSASGRILERIGMQHEGTFKKHIKIWNIMER
jgi:[ribosomal protein S5]-alanine N-acetyltransferase